MARYKVLAGTHSEGGHRYATGEVFESRIRFGKLFPASGKFEKTDEPVTDKKAQASNFEDDDEGNAPEDLGEDVTERFADAGDLDLVVYKQGRKYNVTEKGEKTPLNEEPLANMDEVNDFIAKHNK